ncbi:MAG: RDD family protein [Bacteroidota bacterium]
MDEFEKNFTETRSSSSGAVANKGERIVAAIIDILLAGVLSALIRNPIAWALSTGYLLTRDALPFLEGQSVGKKLLNLRAVKRDGTSLNNDWGSSIVRNITLVIPVMPLVELFVYLVSDKQERLGDQFAQTKVIKQ